MTKTERLFGCIMMLDTHEVNESEQKRANLTGLCKLCGWFLILYWVPVVAWLWFVFSRAEVVWKFVEITFPILLVAGCFWEGLAFRKWFDGPGRRDAYCERFGKRYDLLLLWIPSVLCAAGFISGIGNWLYPMIIPPIPWILILALIAYFAVIIPIDAAAMVKERRECLCWSAFTAWAFCIMYPGYLFIRPQSRRHGWIAIIAILLLIAGLVFSSKHLVESY